MGYLIAAAVIVGLVVFGKKKAPATRFDPAPGTPDRAGNGYQGYVPPDDMGPAQPPTFEQPPPQIGGDKVGGSWDDFERVPNVIFKAMAPNFAKVENGMTGRLYKRDVPGATIWQAAVFKSFIRVWPASPVGSVSIGQALAAGQSAKDNL
jgi:hypothetical protein